MKNWYNNLSFMDKWMWLIKFMGVISIVSIVATLITDNHKVSVIVEPLASFLPTLTFVMIVGYFFLLIPLIKSANSTIETAGNVVDTGKKALDVISIAKSAKLKDIKAVISKVKGFKMPKFEIKDKISKLKFWKKGKK